MADQADVRRIALSLPETVENNERFAFSVLDKGKKKGFAWVWLERLEAKAPRVAQPAVLAVRVSGEDEKAPLIASSPLTFFTEPHYDGFPAVLVRLAEIDLDELEELLRDAWRIQAPRALVKQLDR